MPTARVGISFDPSHVALNPAVHLSPPSNPRSSLARSNRQFAGSTEEDVLSEAQHGEIHVAVRVEVDRVGPGDLGQVCAGIMNFGESEGTADQAVVA